MNKKLILILVYAFVVHANAVSPIIKGDGVAITKERLNLIREGTTYFYADCGFYPKTIYGLIVDIDNCKDWGPEPYVKATQTFSDAWSRPLIYTRYSNSEFEVKSLGPVESDKKSPRGEIRIESP